MPFKPFFGVPSVRHQSALSETLLSIALQKQGADIISLTVCPFGVFGWIFWLFCHLFLAALSFLVGWVLVDLGVSTDLFLLSFLFLLLAYF